MRRFHHEQNYHTKRVAPDIDAKLKNHKTGDMETADKCQLCEKNFADKDILDDTFKSHIQKKIRKHYKHKKKYKNPYYLNNSEFLGPSSVDLLNQHTIGEEDLHTPRGYEDDVLMEALADHLVEIVTETDNLDTEDSEEKKIEDDHMENTIKSRGHNTGRGEHELNQIKLQQDKTRRMTTWHLAADIF